MSSATDDTIPAIDNTIPAESCPAQGNASLRNAPPNVEIVARDRYVIGHELAQGGIGRILRASDKRLERQVALKELLDPRPEHEARFLREALVTAKLQHPAIVPVYDVGRFPNGEIFYAMKLVSGRSLGEVVEEARTLDKRLALLPHVIAVAEAIAYAHSEHIVHRDLKPANVLIGPFGETVVIDWGIAKDLREVEATSSAVPTAPQSDGSTSLTMVGTVLGTPGYMPPEQAEGIPVDERADVYALGAILYHVLAGVAPYEGNSAIEVLTKVLTEPPLPLSSREHGVPPDLLAVVTKAMARDPSQRYPTANEFAHDLRSFQTGQIVGAYHYSRRERVLRFVARHRAVVATTALGLAITCVVAFTSLSRVLDARRIAERERDRANEERERAQQKQSEAEAARWKTMQQSDDLMLLQARAVAKRDPNEAISWLSSLCDAFHRWGEARLIAADAQAHGISKVLRGHTGPINGATYSSDGALIVTASDDRTIRVWNAVTGELVKTFVGHTDEAWRADFTTDGKRILSGSKDGTVRLWDSSTGQTVKEIQGLGSGVYWHQFIDNETRVVLQNCTQKKHLEVHDLATGAIDTLPGDTACPGQFKLSKDQKSIAYAADGKVRVFNFETREYRDYEDVRGRCNFATMTADGKYVACGGLERFYSLWEAGGRQVIHSVPDGSQIWGTLNISRETQYLGFSTGTSLHLRNLENGSTREFHDHSGTIFGIWPSDNGRYMATTSSDHTVVVRDLETDTSRKHFGFHDVTSWLSYSPNQQEFVVGSWDHTARIFPLGTSRDRILAKNADPVIIAGFSAHDDAVVSVTSAGNLRIDPIHQNSGKTATMSLNGRDPVLSSDGALVASASREGTIFVRSTASTTSREFVGHQGQVARLDFSPQNDRLLSVGADKSVRLWDIASGQGRLLFTVPTKIISAAFSPDASLIAIGDTLGHVRVIPTNGGSERTFVGHAGDVNTLWFPPDGNRIISGGIDHTIRIWDLATGNARTIDASGLGITTIIGSRDGKTLYSLGNETGIRRWDVGTGNALPILRGHDDTVMAIDLSPDNTRLISASRNGAIRLWDLASGQSRMLDGHRGEVTSLRFSRSGDKIISSSLDRTVRIWYDDLPLEGDALRDWMARAVPAKKDTPLADH